MNIYQGYCTYLTIYSGNKMPPFYIGSTSVQRVAEGYRGSVKSAKYGKVWAEEIENNPHLFDTRIITLHSERPEALSRENDLHVRLNVVKNPLYINQATAKGTFGMMSPEAKQKELATKSTPEWIETVGKPTRERANVTLRKTLSDPEWKATVDVVRVQKQVETKNDPKWQATVGKKGKEKEMATKNSPEWQATVGVNRIKKQKSTKADPTWQATVGVEQKRKEAETRSNPEWIETIGKPRAKKQAKSISKTLNDPVWKATKGKDQARKNSETQTSDEWKAKHHKYCQYCDRWLHPGVYANWHDDKCTENPDSPRYKPKKK